MALTLLYSEKHNKYLTLIQWSTIIYWNILKLRVIAYHNCYSIVGIISYLNNQYFSYPYIIPTVW